MDHRRFDSSRTAGAAAALGIHQPPLTDEVLNRYMAYFHESGFLPAPGHRSRRNPRCADEGACRVPPGRRPVRRPCRPVAERARAIR
ncbi:hypothetical protein NKH18_05300 [Streptomyces sp. M10(2022)]